MCKHVSTWVHCCFLARHRIDRARSIRGVMNVVGRRGGGWSRIERQWLPPLLPSISLVVSFQGGRGRDGLGEFEPRRAPYAPAGLTPPSLPPSLPPPFSSCCPIPQNLLC